ncbi:MAG: hypothetical protein HY530_00210 [Chloroflexi bacterium]|nr:hypothetical protein [Chloroflexota bacterium]
MNYWINIHWPPLLRDKPTPSSPDPGYHYRVYLPDGREAAGDGLISGDFVFIYETKTGPIRVDGEKYSPGRQGIIALVRTQRSIQDVGSDPEQYIDRPPIDWRWQAPTQFEEAGFCSREDVCRTLGYSRNWTLHGFGDLRSGLKKLTPGEYEALSRCFRTGVQSARATES